MFISVLELFKIGIGPSSSHTVGPMVAANDFIGRVEKYIAGHQDEVDCYISCTLKGSLAFTGKGHGTDIAVSLGLHGYTAEGIAVQDVESLIEKIVASDAIAVDGKHSISFSVRENLRFDMGEPLPEHPNGMIFELIDLDKNVLLSETYFSIGGGFVSTLSEIMQLVAPLKMLLPDPCTYPFDSAGSMLQMAEDSKLSISEMKRINEHKFRSEEELNSGLDAIWQSMERCIEYGLTAEGILPGGLDLPRRAQN